MAAGRLQFLVRTNLYLCFTLFGGARRFNLPSPLGLNEVFRRTFVIFVFSFINRIKKLTKYENSFLTVLRLVLRIGL